MAISTLIIDDEQLARDELMYLLESASDVDVVAQGENGIEAVDLIEEHHPDLVFLDVQMPGQDGFAVIQRVIDRNRARAAGLDGADDAPHLPQFVFATAYDQYAVRAFDVNAVDYLLKPFDRDRVLAAVDRVRARLTSGSANGSSAPSTSESPVEAQPIESQLDALLRLLNRSHGSDRAQPPAKLIVQAQSRLLLVDQTGNLFRRHRRGRHSGRHAQFLRGNPNAARLRNCLSCSIPPASGAPIADSLSTSTRFAK